MTARILLIQEKRAVTDRAYRVSPFVDKIEIMDNPSDTFVRDPNEVSLPVLWQPPRYQLLSPVRHFWTSGKPIAFTVRV